MRLLVVVIALMLALPAHAEPKGGILWFKDDAPVVAKYNQSSTQKFVTFVAKQMRWKATTGTFLTQREDADAYIAAEKPKFGFIQLPAFIAFRAKYKLTAIATMKSPNLDGTAYHLVSNTRKNADGCKGQLVASTHFVDPRFMDKVVAKGAWASSDFTVLSDDRDGLETVRKLLNKKVACSLLDEREFSGLRGISDGDTLKEIWKSEMMPFLVVVAFPSASAAERKAFAAKLATLCDGKAGKEGCALMTVGELTLDPDKALAPLIEAYGE
jgi:hypothetical protein